MDAHPENAWSWFALAGTTVQSGDDKEALRASARAFELAPNHPDVQYLRANLLRLKESSESAFAFIDSVNTPTSNLLVIQGKALYDAAGDYTPTVDELMIDSAFATFAAARALDSTNVEAHLRPGTILRRKRRADEAWPLLKRAAELSPMSDEVHLGSNHAILSDPDLTDEEKHNLITADVERMLSDRPNGPETIYMAIDLYGDVNDVQKRNEMEERLMEIEPRGPRTEWVLISRIRRFEDEHGEELYGDEAGTSVKQQYWNMNRAFLERDWHESDGLIGEASRNWFMTADSTVSNDQIVDIVDGMVRYETLNPHITYRRGAIELAERGLFEKAESVVLAGFEPMREQVTDRQDRYESQEEYTAALNNAESMMRDALGWVYFLEGRLDDAEEQLARAYELSDGKNLDAVYRLGRLYEERYDRSGEGGDRSETAIAVGRESHYVTAFQYYSEGTRLSSAGENPNEAALESLYRTKNRSLEGFEAFRAALEADNEAARREEVLANRLDEPKALEPFNLERIDGGTYDSSELDGKVAVINVWATSCGPCLWEMPDLQELYEKYQDDPDVAVLTINFDQNPDDARALMEERGLTLPVLLDDGYMAEMNVLAYPTSWFVGRDGQIAFEKIGWTKHLVQEFSWRLEELR